MLTAIQVVVLLLLLNAMFVAAEFGVLRAKESRVRLAAEAGGKSARLLLPIMQDPRQLDRFISACQLGVTVTSLGLGAYCESKLAEQLALASESNGMLSTAAAHSIATVVALVALTVFQVVLAEVMPKSLALHRPNKVAAITVWPVVAWQRTLGFVITFLNGSARLVLRLLRSPVVVDRHVHSRQEIDLIMEESHEKGVIEADQHKRLQHVLDLEVVTARQLMIPRNKIAALDTEAEDEDKLEIMMRGRHTRMPVYRGTIDDMVGVMHTKDIARHAVEKGSIKDWRKLIRPINFVNEGMTADRLLAVLREKRTQQAIVMDEFGGVAGLVTLEDVLTHVFGEVGDEFSENPTHPQRLSNGLVRLPGRLRLSEAEGWISVLWSGASTTIGGFITECLGHIPEPGEKLTVDGVDVEVERVENHLVTSVLARPVEPRREKEAIDG